MHFESVWMLHVLYTLLLSHTVPTLEELNPQFAGSTVFSKLDAKAGYWSVHLDPDSQLITTFRTPFGRYC